MTGTFSTPMTPSCGSRHADVGEICGPAWQNLLICGLDVRVRADDGCHLAVEVPSHCDLLRGGFRVEVDENDPRARAQRLDLLEHAFERVVELLHENAAHHVDDADRPPLRGSGEIAAVVRERPAGKLAGRSSRASAPM